MPSFNTGLSAQQMSLTPPEIYCAYADSIHGSERLTAMPFAGCHGSFSRYEQERQEERTAAKHFLPPLASNSRSVYGADHHVQYPSSQLVSTSSARNVYGLTTVPMLPRIRTANDLPTAVPQQVKAKSESDPSVTQVKEEKVGGVALHLDYEMDEMIDFVSEMAQGMYEIYASRICLADIDMTRSIVNSKSSIPADLRKYVCQVLTSTRLPSSTILVGLHYLTERMTLLSASGKYSRGSGEVYHMLVTALLLGSKFMDDNTFQNRSWSEVSNIAVGDLNDLEIEWLVDIKWNMHIDPHDPQGFSLWHSRWERSKAKNVEMSLARSMQQTHIEFEERRQPLMQQSLPPASGYARMYAHPGSDSPFGDRSRSCWNTPRYDPWTSSCTQNDYSPPSAPETGPSTPNSYGVLDGFSYGLMQQTYPSVKLPSSFQAIQSSISQSVYARSYNQYHNHYGHANHCGCNYCMSHQENYFSAPGYGPQAVAG